MTEITLSLDSSFICNDEAAVECNHKDSAQSLQKTDGNRSGHNGDISGVYHLYEGRIEIFPPLGFVPSATGLISLRGCSSGL
jgi:hypothetical protein